MAETGRRPPPFNPALNEAQTSNDIQSTETKMRRALGLTANSGSQVAQQRPEQARQRHRFVQDGGVPVVMMGNKPEPETAALRERIAALESTLEAERANHAATRRAAQEQYANLQALQTRFAHTELAHTEALEGERRLRAAAQQALLDTQASIHVASPPVRRTKPVESLRPPVIEPEQGPLPLPVMPPRKTAPAPVAEKPRRGRPRINPLPEPKPVRWWTPSFRSKGKG